MKTAVRRLCGCLYISVLRY